ncbi:O-antigen ligase family protein [Hymenobacter cavernae]|uniref:O-antigen ligase-related domain-containing protein n=1 Tax=Hymenobacter cavernae TaxID=2044852 RepID=A0ABQ1TTL0_9BACT|nr:O-antigen ligase family protein [Hymenobacter cavernae]GGF01587.1 hypothetical protein GCM10011383_10570 [Hymenobacter cavernae]
MKISLRFLLLLPMLAVLATNAAFWEFVYGPQVDQEPDAIKLYTYMLFAASMGCIVLYWRHIAPIMRLWILITLACIGGLMLESYGNWGLVMVYPHVFSKLLVLLILFGIYTFYRRFGMPPLRQLFNVLTIVLLADLLVFHRDSLSASAFVENERGYGAAAAYLFVPITLFNLNSYLVKGRISSLLFFFFCLPLIIFLQHRSVWIATAVAIPINVLLLRRVPGVRFSLPKLVMLIVLPAILGSIGVTAVVLDNPEIVQRLQDSIEDISNADKQGTGSWRLKQIESYMPLVQERPVAGWRLEGFEVPMQFYDPSSDQPMWADRTGHHFHNFYLDRAFYFGILGIMLVLVVPIISVVRRLLQRAPLVPETAAFIAYFFCLLVYSASYDWATYHFGMLGLMLASLPLRAPEPEPEYVPAMEVPQSIAEPLAPVTF